MARQKNSRAGSKTAHVINLPRALTSFIGRRREQTTIEQLLAGTRLLTLTGASGCGKTRLAMELVSRLSDEFEDIYWIDLAPLLDPSRLPVTVAHVLGFQGISKQPVLEALSDYLCSRHMLLVLDNAEYVLSAAAELVQVLLRNCLDLKLLVTSREALKIAGETIWLVPSLDLPRTFSLPPPARDSESLARYDAIQLFVERAKSVLTTFRITNENMASVLEICERLDGMPLAIELAAARVNVLSVEQIVARLDDRFNLLTRGVPSLLPRHQTLRAAIDWSYDLLSDQERLLFCRLAVFSGSATLEAIETICGTGELANNRVFDLLSSLIGKSLVVAEMEGEGDARYRLLNTMRQYAHDKLLALAEGGQAYKRHLDWYLQMAEEAERHLRSAEQIPWLARLDAEHANLSAALECSLGTSGDSQPDVENGLRLAAALWQFWAMRGYLREGRGWFERLLKPGAEPGKTATRAKALNRAAALAFFQGDVPGAAALGEEGLQLCRELGDAWLTAANLLILGQYALLYKRDFEYAEKSIQESVRLARETGDKWLIAVTLTSTALQARLQGDHGRASTIFSEALALAWQSADGWLVSGLLGNLAGQVSLMSDYARASQLYQESLALRRKLEDKGGVAGTLNDLAQLARWQGDTNRAIALYEESLALFEQLGQNESIALVLSNLGYAALQLGNVRHAVELLVKSLGQFRDQDNRVGTALCLAGLAAAAAETGKQAAERSERGEWARRAACLSGAADMLLEALHAALPPADGMEYERQMQIARQELGAEAFELECREGRAMPPEQAIVYALTQPAPPHPTIIANTPDLRILALGPMQVYRQEHLLTSVDWVLNKSRELLFYLLLHENRTKEQIGLDLWPDASPEQLRTNLKVAIHHLRRALGDGQWILFEDDRYSFNRALAPRYWFDVQVFESNLTRTSPLVAKSPSQALVLLEGTTQLYRGDLLEDLAVGDWYLPWREELQRKYLEALLTLGQLLFDAGRYDEAVDRYRQILACDPYFEAVHRELMRSYARQGEQSRALKHYRTLAETMRNDLASAPARETTALFEELRQGIRV